MPKPTSGTRHTILSDRIPELWQIAKVDRFGAVAPMEEAAIGCETFLA